MSEPQTMRINNIDYIRKDSVPAPYVSRKDGPYEIGKCYLVFTVTAAIHGRLVEVTPQELVLTNAAWIADTGRFSDFITGKIEPKEIEPFPWNEPVVIGRGSIIYASIRDGEFKVQK